MPAKPYSRFTRRPGKGAEKFLGELESTIMNEVWGRESATVRDVLDALSEEHRLAYTTVMTVMGRLANKGLLVAEKHGKTYYYKAAMTKAEFEARSARQVVRSLIADFGSAVVLSQFVQELSSVDPDQLARLAEMAHQAQEEQGDG